MPKLDRETIELILIAIAALFVAVQTIFLIVLVSVLGKFARNAHEEIQELRSSIMPIIYSTRDIITRIAPKIEESATEIAALTQSLRKQTSDVQAAATDLIGRAQRIASRMDAMATTALDGVERAAEFVSGAVAVPVRQVSGILASVRAILDTLRNPDYSARSSSPSGRATVDPRAADKDMFV
jgi:methyl-accepting chemotaxis protein